MDHTLTRIHGSLDAWKSRWSSLRAFAEQHPATRILVFAAAYIATSFPYERMLQAAFNPSEAILLAYLLLLPPRRWRPYLLVASAVQVWSLWSIHIPLGVGVFVWAANIVGPIVIARLVGLDRSLDPFSAPFASIRSISSYSACVLIGASTAALLAAIGIAGLGSLFWGAWWAWVLRDCLTALAFVPALVLCFLAGPRDLLPSSRQRQIETLVLYGGLLFIGVVGFASKMQGEDTSVILYLPMPLLLWAAVRFGPRGTALALSLIYLLSVASIARGLDTLISRITMANIRTVQLDLLVIGVPLFFVAALVEEHRQAVSVQVALVHERGKALAIATESEKRYRAFFEHNAIGALLMDPWEGRRLRINDAFCRMLGYPREALLNTTLSVHTHPDDREAEVEMFRRLVRGEVSALSYEKRYMRADGQIVWAQADVTMLRDDAGEPLHSLTLVQDITARKQAVDDLRASEERFHTMADTAPVLIWVAGYDGQVTFLNAPWLRFTGRTHAQEVGDGWAEGIHPNDLARCLETYLAAVRARRPFTMEYRLRRHDGQYRWIVDSGVPRVGANGEFVGYIGSAVDITERKQMADELERLSTQLLRAQDDERRRIARELHDSTAQTLTAVHLNLARLSQMLGPRGSDGGRIAGVLDESFEQLRQAATELRTLSYLLHPPQLDEYGLAAALAWYVEGFAQRSGLRINLQVRENFGRLATSVETVLYRVAQEALSNVYRHSGSPSVRLWLSKGKGIVRLRIEDHGIGMAAAVAGGDRGDRGTGAAPGDVASAATSDVSSHPEMGVGIAGMRQRLQQLGGHLEIRSTVRGTLVSAIVPLIGKSHHAG